MPAAGLACPAEASTPCLQARRRVPVTLPSPTTEPGTGTRPAAHDRDPRPSRQLTTGTAPSPAAPDRDRDSFCDSSCPGALEVKTGHQTRWRQRMRRADLLKRTMGLDALACPRCGGHTCHAEARRAIPVRLRGFAASAGHPPSHVGPAALRAKAGGADRRDPGPGSRRENIAVDGSPGPPPARLARPPPAADGF